MGRGDFKFNGIAVNNCPDGYLTLSQFAKLHNLPYKFVKSRVDSRKLPGIQIRRYIYIRADEPAPADYEPKAYAFRRMGTQGVKRVDDSPEVEHLPDTIKGVES